MLDKTVLMLLARNFGWVSVHLFLLTVEIFCFISHSTFNNFPLQFWVSWNGLKSKDISGRNSYTRYLNYYISSGMTAHIREVDMSPCSYVLFILELEAIINYLGVKQHEHITSDLYHLPHKVVSGLNFFNSHFISVLLNLLMIVDTSNRYWGSIKAAPLFAGLQLDHLQWPQGSQGSEAGWWSSGDGVVVQKLAPVSLDNRCLMLSHCLLYLLPNLLSCQGAGALHLLPPG